MLTEVYFSSRPSLKSILNSPVKTVSIYKMYKIFETRLYFLSRAKIWDVC